MKALSLQQKTKNNLNPKTWKGKIFMKSKSYNKMNFSAEINGQAYSFYCESTNTRCGFCHHVYDHSEYGTNLYHTRVSYYNRTWERFDYETALLKHFNKYPKELREALKREIIDRENARIDARLDAFNKSLKVLSDNLQKVREHRPDAYKNIEVTSMDQAQGLMSCVALEAAFC